MEINENIVKAGRLDHSVIGIYSQSALPEDAFTVASIMKGEHPCVARALFLMSKDDDIPAICVEGAGSNDCCSGAKLLFGFKEFPPNMENMFSSDSPNSESMRIKGSAALCRTTFRDMGKMVPLGRYIVMRKLSEIKADPSEVASILCFGNAGQIRNLGAMVHHGEARAYAPIMAPWGSGCATFVSYPSGMAVAAPKDTAFLGPMTPEAEGWLPADMLALGIPMNVAVRMAEGYGCSFAARR
jgi:hypothetical protein